MAFAQLIRMKMYTGDDLWHRMGGEKKLRRG